ncbi:MAG: DinB family protein [Chloroflexota bacterium]|nr:DinB family protein [Chloroflexota bacterium]MDP9469263.1 DinB family protein [Chloroflexota bacterium]
MENEGDTGAVDWARLAGEAVNAQPERADPDLEPLGHDDVAAGVAAITVTRTDLLRLVEEAGPGALQRRESGGDGWTVGRVLLHIAGGELFFLNRLGLADRLPEEAKRDDPLQVLDETRRQVLNELNTLDEEWLSKVVEADGEAWTLRKVLRRLQEHEAEHLKRVRSVLVAE